MTTSNKSSSWKQRNARRVHLVQKKVAGTLSENEKSELSTLQKEAEAKINKGRRSWKKLGVNS